MREKCELENQKRLKRLGELEVERCDTDWQAMKTEVMMAVMKWQVRLC